MYILFLIRVFNTCSLFQYKTKVFNYVTYHIFSTRFLFCFFSSISSKNKTSRRSRINVFWERVGIREIRSINVYIFTTIFEHFQWPLGSTSTNTWKLISVKIMECFSRLFFLRYYRLFALRLSPKWVIR